MDVLTVPLLAVIPGFDWPTLAVLAGLVTMWTVVFLWAVKVMLDREHVHVDQRMESLIELISASADRQHELEKSILELRVELAKNYVHREDWLRFHTAIHRKFDLLFEMIEKQKDNSHVA